MVWADALQMFIMLGGFLAVLVAGVISEGGLPAVWQTAKEGGRLNLLEYIHPYSLTLYLEHFLS